MNASMSRSFSVPVRNERHNPIHGSFLSYGDVSAHFHSSDNLCNRTRNKALIKGWPTPRLTVAEVRELHSSKNYADYLFSSIDIAKYGD